MAKFSEAVDIVLKNEGGYVNDPKDPGGETNFGISKAAHPGLDIKNLSEDDAKSIYYTEYWYPNKLSELNNQSVANFALDTLVHHGKGGLILQEAVNVSGGSTVPDNKVGPHTIASINAIAPSFYLQNAVARRIAYMEELVRNNPSLAKFLRGWKMRAAFFLLRPYLPIGILMLAGLTAWYLLRKNSQS